MLPKVQVQTSEVSASTPKVRAISAPDELIRSLEAQRYALEQLILDLQVQEFGVEQLIKGARSL